MTHDGPTYQPESYDLVTDENGNTWRIMSVELETKELFAIQAVLQGFLKDPGDYPLMNLYATWQRGGLTLKERKPIELMAAVDRRAIRDQEETDRLLTASKQYYFQTDVKNGDHHAALWLCRTRSVITDENDHLYAYVQERGYYESAGEALLRHDLVTAYGTMATKTRMAEILAKARGLSFQREKELAKTIPPNLLPLANGIYDLTTKKLLPHDPKYFFTYTHPVQYDPGATCPEILKFLETSVPDEQQRETLLDIAALCLYRARVTRRFFILQGQGHNGKSKFIDLLKAFIGKERAVSITPQALAEDVFAPAQLVEKHANLGADIPGGVIKDLTIIKTTTGGDTVSVQRKGVDREERDIYCEFVWSSNVPPRVLEDTHAIWDRLTVIVFPFTFTTNPTLPTERLADPDLEAKIYDPKELSGLFNLAVARLPGLLARRDLTRPVNAEEMRRQYRTLSDTVSVFLEECCEEAEHEPGDHYTPASGREESTRLYATYKAWCKQNRVSPVSNKRFSKQLEAAGFENYKSNGLRYYTGIQLLEKGLEVLHSPILPACDQVSSSKGKTSTLDTSATPEAVPVIQAEDIQETPADPQADALRALRTADLLAVLGRFGDRGVAVEVLALAFGPTIISHLQALATSGSVYQPIAGRWAVVVR